MDLLTSTANCKVKEVKKLNLKKYRDSENLYIAEGVNIICDMPLDIAVDSFFVTEKVYQKSISKIDKFGAKIYLVSDNVMSAISDTDSPSGLLAVINKPIQKNLSGNCLVLDGISDPGNIGTIIRTASGAGYNDIITINCVDVYSPKVVRSTMGGIFRTNIIDANYESLNELLKDYTKISADMSGDNVFDYIPKNKIALFLGNEAHGVSKYLQDLSDITLSLPMFSGQESLNVGVAGGILMYVLNNNFNKNK